MEQKPYMIFAGNPGVGKSTMLNSIAGRIVFPSGPSLGQGMTTGLDRIDIGPVVLADTPGLADVSLREKAAVAIRNALRDAHRASLYFIVTLEAGRVRPVDVATINTVLDAIVGVDMTNKFGIIINKLSKKVIDKINNDVDGKTRLFGCLTTKFKTLHIFLNPSDADLNDESNGLKPLSSDMREFIASVTTFEIQEIRPLSIDNFDRNTEALEEMLQRMMDSQEEQVLALKNEISSLQSQVAQQQQSDPFGDFFRQIMDVAIHEIAIPFVRNILIPDKKTSSSESKK